MEYKNLLILAVVGRYFQPIRLDEPCQNHSVRLAFKRGQAEHLTCGNKNLNR